MNNDRITQALSRIEAATGRIAAAAAAPRHADAALEQRYQVLRQEAGAALGDIDRLIAALEK